MARKHRKTREEVPTDYDLGTGTKAQRRGTIIEPVPEDANGRKRRRRVPVFDMMHRRGALTNDQANAAEMLSLAWEKTQRSAPAINPIQVDSSPKPDANIAIMLDRQSALAAALRDVPSRYRYVLFHVVVHDRPIAALPGKPRGKRAMQHLDNLRFALDVIADRRPVRVKRAA